MAELSELSVRTIYNYARQIRAEGAGWGTGIWSWITISTGLAVPPRKHKKYTGLGEPFEF
jgi:hypothetical protein